MWVPAQQVHVPPEHLPEARIECGLDSVRREVQHLEGDPTAAGEELPDGGPVLDGMGREDRQHRLLPGATFACQEPAHRAASQAQQERPDDQRYHSAAEDLEIGGLEVERARHHEDDASGDRERSFRRAV